MCAAVLPVNPLSTCCRRCCCCCPDGILTPAISVVSAVEGIQFQVSMSNGECTLAAADAAADGLALLLRLPVLAQAVLLPRTALPFHFSCFNAAPAYQLTTSPPPSLLLPAGVVVAISIVILFLLFAAQSLGTQKVSFAFSPIMLLWFLANAAIGLVSHPTCSTSAAKSQLPLPSPLGHLWLSQC